MPTKQEIKIYHQLINKEISQREACRQLGISRGTLASVILKVLETL